MKADFEIVVEAIGDRRSEVIRVTRNAARTDHHGAQRLLQHLPVIVRRGVTHDIAKHFLEKFTEAGAQASIRPAKPNKAGAQTQNSAAGSGNVPGSAYRDAEKTVVEASHELSEIAGSTVTVADNTLKGLASAAEKALGLSQTIQRGSGTYEIILEATGDRHSEVLRVVRNAARTDHHGAKRLMADLPISIRRGVPLNIAEHFKTKFEELGAGVTIKEID